MRELLSEYSDRFPERLPDGLPPMRDTFHTIPLQPRAKPCFERARRCSPAQRVEMERQVKELLDLGYIVPSSSPFGCPVLFVGKKDGGLRMCIDYRALNRITIQNKWPLPRIDDLFDQLRGAKVFTALDLMSGYHQLRIHPDDEDKTAFVTPFGHYQYKVLCFGLTNASTTFQECMSRTFKDQVNKFVLVYMDDIIIYSRTAAEHLEHLRVVLQILRENQFYCKKSKCQFALPEMLYLGHTVSEKGIAVDPKKIAKVAGWLESTTKLELQRFLGLTNYFRKFIPKYAEMVAPLTNLTRKKCEWNWDTSCQHAFDKVKHALVTPPLLAFPDPQQPYQVVTDASCVGIAAVLLQNDRPVAYESRKLSPAEKNYTTTEQELLAVVHALRVWQCYLEGATFEVVTDHCPNTYLQTQPSLSRRQARWAEFLQRFGFTWTYKPGKTNIADPLSRDPAFLAQVTFRETSHSRSHMLNAIASVRALRSHSPQGETIAAQAAKGYQADPWFSRPRHLGNLERRGDLWWHSGKRLAVPNVLGLRELILNELHDARYSGHVGIKKTLRAVARDYWWRKLDKDVRQWVATCDHCQRNKASNKSWLNRCILCKYPMRSSIALVWTSSLSCLKRRQDMMPYWSSLTD